MSLQLLFVCYTFSMNKKSEIPVKHNIIITSNTRKMNDDYISFHCSQVIQICFVASKGYKNAWTFLLLQLLHPTLCTSIRYLDTHQHSNFLQTIRILKINILYTLRLKKAPTFKLSQT